MYRILGAGWTNFPALQGVAVALTEGAVLTLYMWIPTLRAYVGVRSVLFLLWISLFLLDAGDLGHGTGKLGDWTGLLTGIDALNVSLVDV